MFLVIFLIYTSSAPGSTPRKLIRPYTIYMPIVARQQALYMPIVARQQALYNIHAYSGQAAGLTHAYSGRGAGLIHAYSGQAAGLYMPIVASLSRMAKLCWPARKLLLS